MELEGGKLKDRMQKMIQDRNKAVKVGMKLISSDGKSTTGISSAKDVLLKPTSNLRFHGDKTDDLMRQALLQAQEKERILVEEHRRLRHLFRLVYRQLNDLLVTPVSLANAPEDLLLEDSHFFMPLNMDVPGEQDVLYRGMEYILGELAVQFSELAKHARDPVDAEILNERDERIDDLERRLATSDKQLDEYRYVVQEQAKLLEEAMSKDFGRYQPDNDIADLSMYCPYVFIMSV